jgi:hypothetical protein
MDHSSKISVKVSSMVFQKYMDVMALLAKSPQLKRLIVNSTFYQEREA